MDAIVGDAMAAAERKNALLIVASDHGFASFRKHVHYNTWLVLNGYMTLKAGVQVKERNVEMLFDQGQFWENVDWSKTRAYAMGLGELYINLKGREAHGIVELTVIGSPPDPSCPALARELREIRWRPVCSAAELRAELSAHDVLLSPSLFDGFNPILLDAMAAGLPVIATRQTAAPDLIDDGCEGFIVPFRSPDAIVARLETLHQDPELLRAMSAQARERAQRHDWDRYERALAASVAAALTHR
jgi:glycosyltransferase involved in cell wall biosynthesis